MKPYTIIHIQMFGEHPNEFEIGDPIPSRRYKINEREKYESRRKGRRAQRYRLRRRIFRRLEKRQARQQNKRLAQNALHESINQ